MISPPYHPRRAGRGPQRPLPGGGGHPCYILLGPPAMCQPLIFKAQRTIPDWLIREGVNPAWAGLAAGSCLTRVVSTTAQRLYTCGPTRPSMAASSTISSAIATATLRIAAATRGASSGDNTESRPRAAR
jgi:hypothetical protein